jgi:glucose-specific phosphotransferase system IIA component
MMGEGIVIKPTSSKIYSPLTGTMLTVFPTGHAYGITNKEGLTLLIHIGLDTVGLKGKGFTSHVKQGQKIKRGDLIAEIDIPYIKKNAPSADVIVVVTPESTIKVARILTGKKVKKDDSIILV